MSLVPDPGLALAAIGNPADWMGWLVRSSHTQFRGFASPGHPGFAFIDATARTERAAGGGRGGDQPKIG
jgi:hypothetical protein